MLALRLPGKPQHQNMIPEDNKWELLKSEEGPAIPLFKIRYDFQKNNRNGKVIKSLVLESQDSVNVIAITPEKRMLLVQQLRFGVNEETIELPGGLVDEGEDHQTAVIREFREETGYTSDNWEYLGAVQSNPVFMDSKIHHWLALDVRRTHKVELDDGENIELLEIPINGVRKYVHQNKIQHPHTLSALSRVMNLWKPKL